MKILRKSIHYFLRTKEFKKVIESRQRAKLSIEELRDIQLKSFLDLIEHARENSLYYSSILGDLKIEKLEDLDRIPILTKELINSKFDEILCQKDKKYFVKNSTSGSTGDATIFGSDKRYILNKNVDAIRGDELSGNNNYLDRTIVFWGAKKDLLKKRSVKNLYNQYVRGIKVISTYHMTEDDIRENIKIINDFKPRVIVGYPSALNFMANYLQINSKLLAHIPESIISAGEMLYSVQKENIEAGFSSKVYNRYGCRETSHIANECEFRNGLHYDIERIVIEVVDDNGLPCHEGKKGNILITDLNNYVFPMIRYNIGDIGTIQKYSLCQCGVNLPKLESIEGRAFDVIQGLNGNAVSGSFWTLMFRYEIDGVEGFQIRQKALGFLTISLKVNEKFNNIEKEKITNYVKVKLGMNMSIETKIVKNFEFTAAGKFKWVISDMAL